MPPVDIESLERGDEITITYKSTGMYNAGTPETHHGKIVKKLEDDSDNQLEYKIIYRENSGEVFLLDRKVGHIYTHENDKMRTLKGTDASIENESD